MSLGWTGILASHCKLVQSQSGRSFCRWISSAVQRGSNYAELNQADVAAFTDILGSGGVVQDETALDAANEDWMGKYKGNSKLLLRPKTTQQTSDILKHCNDRRLAVVPQGGNSGLVGGSVPLFDEVIVSFASMKRILSLDKVNGALTCQAGSTLQELDDHAREHGFLMPLDLGAKGSCQAGGFVSTNAGGLRFLRYGSLHGSVLGLEAVLADGTILNSMQTLPKDNTGYDLKQLFIGAEGTLGLITAVAIRCPFASTSTNLAYLACESYEAVTEVYRRARRELGEILSAFEFLDRQALELTKQHLENVKDPLPSTNTQFYLVVETSGSNAEHDMAKLEGFLTDAMEEGLIADGTIAQDTGQAQGIWGLREGISVALRHAGATYKYDLSLPPPALYTMVEVMRQRLSHHDVRVVGYGHLGDSNLHLNISSADWKEEVRKEIEPFVYEWTAEHGGSISAEHGLGQMKPECIRYSKSPEMVGMMHRVKDLFDPNHILNPYKLLPQRTQ
ncbi:hypothetical protein WJX73_005363 [Symbiochloris irregularis]|uniref:D-2-hydroxyglutarate dehydrogenase n=1 Tax=Symbiochloris irregularis TaxID=706552 RepID=A0AAW1NWT0_9CHLO